METVDRTILVPWDFTPSSVYALQHAVNIAKIRDFSITLLHVIKDAREETITFEKLKRIADDNQQATEIFTTALIQKGKIFKCIRELAASLNAAIVVMKTDGVKGSQRYFGSKAIKLMKGSAIPFMVVQQPPAQKTFERIVLPIDYRTENKELISYIAHLSNYYAADLYLFKVFSKDQLYKKNISNNLNFARSVFDGKQIKYNLVNAKGEEDSAKELLKFANQVKADLIMIQLQRNLTLTKFLFGVREQGVIANEYKIPVICLNPKELTVYAGFR